MTKFSNFKKASKLNSRGRTIMLSLIAVFTALIIAGTFIKIDLGFISFTLQTFAVQLTSSMLGAFWGALVVLLYLFMGLIGIPIFTKGGGFMYVLLPTFGYMIGFLIGSIAGALIINLFKKKNFWAYLSGNIVNLFITYACGMIYFYFLQTFYFGKAVTAYTVFISCFLIFLPADFVFTLVASGIATKLKPILDKMIYQTATDEDIENYEKQFGEISATSSELDINGDSTEKELGATATNNVDSAEIISDTAQSNETDSTEIVKDNTFNES